MTANKPKIISETAFPNHSSGLPVVKLRTTRRPAGYSDLVPYKMPRIAFTFSAHPFYEKISLINSKATFTPLPKFTSLFGNNSSLLMCGYVSSISASTPTNKVTDHFKSHVDTNIGNSQSASGNAKCTAGSTSTSDITATSGGTTPSQTSPGVADIDTISTIRPANTTTNSNPTRTPTP